MTGGIAVRRNLLCVTWSSARGQVFLFDLQAGVPTSSWAVPAPPGGYSDAGGVAMDDHFHLFVADAENHCVRHFSAFGRHLGDLGGAPAAGGAAARDRPGVTWRPRAVAIVLGDLLVAAGDQPMRRAVQRFAPDGRPLGHLRSLGDPEGEFAAPQGLYADGDGILVADTLQGRIQRFRCDGSFVASIACGGSASRARPTALVRTADQRIVVLDRGDEPRVRAFAPHGQEAAVGALATRCDHGVALARDEADRIYLLDRGGERVQRFHPDLSFDAVVVDLAEHLDGFPTATP